MTLSRHLAVALLVQAFGATTVLLATISLAVSAGPEVQGVFNRTKAEIEFVAALTMFGLPQALFFYTRSGRLTIEAAFRWSAICMLVSVAIGVLYAVVRHQTIDPAGVMFGVAVGAFALHGVFRGLVLLDDSTTWFSKITVLPQVIVLVGVLLSIALATYDSTQWYGVFAVALGIGAAVAYKVIPRRLTTPLHASATAREVWSYGATAWFAAGLSTGVVIFVQLWVEREQGLRALGQFTMGLTLAQVLLTPINYAAPLLFRHWMGQADTDHSMRWAVQIAGAVLVVAGCLPVATMIWPEAGLGSSYEGMRSLLAVLLIGTAAEAMTKLLVVRVNASGRPRIGVIAEFARCTCIGAGVLVFEPRSLLATCAIWSAGAWVGATILAAEASLGARGRALT